MSPPPLTMEDLDGPDWEPALTFPFPAHPDIALLFKTRDRVIAFLQWVTDLAQVDLCRFDPEKTADEIQRAAVRLIEITDLTPDAMDADVAEVLEIAARYVDTLPARSLKGFLRIEVRIETKGFLDSVTEE